MQNLCFRVTFSRKSFSEYFDSVHGEVYMQQAAGHFIKIEVHHCALDSFLHKLQVSKLT